MLKSWQSKLAGPDCGEDAVDNMLDDDVGSGAAELAFGERIDHDDFNSWFCCDSAKSKYRIVCRGPKMTGCVAGEVSYCFSRR